MIQKVMTYDQLYYLGVIPHDNAIQHHGILGMHWGIRRYQPYPSEYQGDGKYTGRTNRQVKRTEKMAKKDAKRYANAKMYYGEGAGTRRKLLKAELEKKQKDPVYKKAFDEAVGNADYAKAAQRAVRERTVRDSASKAKSTLKKIGRVTGVTAASLGAMYYMQHKEQIDAFVANAGKALMKNAGDAVNRGKTVASSIMNRAKDTVSNIPKPSKAASSIVSKAKDAVTNIPKPGASNSARVDKVVPFVEKTANTSKDTKGNRGQQMFDEMMEKINKNTPNLNKSKNERERVKERSSNYSRTLSRLRSKDLPAGWSSQFKSWLMRNPNYWDLPEVEQWQRYDWR